MHIVHAHVRVYQLCEVRSDWRSGYHGFALPVKHHSNFEIDNETFSTVILIPSYSKDSCQLLAKPQFKPFFIQKSNIGRWEHIGIIGLPSARSIKANLDGDQLGNIVGSPEQKTHI